ncbi:MAG TPA: serine/threonine-protein kinase [Gemmatimonadales bacterium]|nr:serine/threonine-protein kinase [Gemmatimonadales bacterium]
MSSILQEQLQLALRDAYVLERELGGGGMSRVFLALELALGRKVVVKVLLPELAAGVNVERFRREIQLAAQLQHPHIVPLLAAGEADGLPYFIMPFVTGESLRKRLAREGELPIAETVRILRDVVSALAYAHACGVVHRDVKPDNVLLSGGVAVVTDFGVAKAVSASSNSGETGLTSLGVALGTPAYMAPEQATANPQTDHRADIYALGVVAYELLTGSQPFAGRSPQAVLAAHVVEEPEPVERRRPAVPPMLAALVKDCLAKRPAERPQTAVHVMHVLDAIGTPSGGTAPTTAIRVTAAPAPEHKRPLVGYAAALAVLVAGGSLWLLRPGPAAAPVQGAVAPDPTHAVLSHAESAFIRPPMPPPDPARIESPAARRSAPPPAAPPARAARPDPARSQRPAQQPAPAAPAPVALNPATEPAPAMESLSAPAVAPAAAAAAPPLAPPVAVAETPLPQTPPATVPPVPPQPAEPRPVAPRAAAPRPDPAAEVRSLIADYAAAVESNSLAVLQRVYPGMTAMQQRGWEQFFQLVRDVKAQLSVARLDTAGGVANAQVTGTYTYLNTSTGRTESQPVSFRATFEHQGGRWRMAQVR